MAAKGTKRKDSAKGGPVTLQTIADILGVSRTTVSNAFSKPDQMTPELRARILKTADQLGYCGPDASRQILEQVSTGHLTVGAAVGVSPA